MAGEGAEEEQVLRGRGEHVAPPPTAPGGRVRGEGGGVDADKAATGDDCEAAVRQPRDGGCRGASGAQAATCG